jgi:hypothetical protein
MVKAYRVPAIQSSVSESCILVLEKNIFNLNNTGTSRVVACRCVCAKINLVLFFSIQIVLGDAHIWCYVIRDLRLTEQPNEKKFKIYF